MQRIAIFNLTELFELVERDVMTSFVTNFNTISHPEGYSPDLFVKCWFRKTSLEYRIIPKGILLPLTNIPDDVANKIIKDISPLFDRLLYKILRLPKDWLKEEPVKIMLESNNDLIFYF